MRASMGKSRISLLHIHYDSTVDLDVVLYSYGRPHPKRIGQENFCNCFSSVLLSVTKNNNEGNVVISALSNTNDKSREFGNNKFKGLYLD